MENYFWTTKTNGDNDIYVLVIYDIVNNKTRTAFAKKWPDTDSEFKNPLLKH